MTNLPLDAMSIEEKLQAMEALWDDLCRSASDSLAPQWHGEVLADREAAVDQGKQRPQDWESAKQELRQRLT